ncbi:DsbA family protein [Candidatus Uhrbacteria bacterium]|nr:DsbA family protein [Candidatus Uhrbacteria bacterium]
MSIGQTASTTEPWYKKGWGILLIAGLLILFGGLTYIGVKTVEYYGKIRIGEIPPEVRAKITYGNIQPPSDPKENLAYDAKDDPAFGNPAAPLQIVEFADFECPYSRDESAIVRELQARFPEKIYFIYRDFPLEDIHPHAFRASEAANCAQDQGKFWAMHDKLYQNAQRLSDLDLKTYALEIGLNIVKFNACFDSRKYKEEIEGDRADGIAAGVVGTPTFFINGQKVEGAIPMPVWEQIISRAK